MQVGLCQWSRTHTLRKDLGLGFQGCRAGFRSLEISIIGHRAVLQTHAWRNELGCLYYPCHEGENPGYVCVSAVLAGAHVVRAFLLEAKPVSHDRKLGEVGGSERGLKIQTPLSR